MEIWKALPEDSKYEISNLGKVRKNGKIKKQGPNSAGYYQTTINSKLRLVHRLVALTFNPPKYAWLNIADHKNQQITDNRAENLRWVTKAFNNINNSAKGYSKRNKKYLVTQSLLGQQKRFTYDTREQAATAAKEKRSFRLEALSAVYEILGKITDKSTSIQRGPRRSH
jgi:hypothetical protein